MRPKAQEVFFLFLYVKLCESLCKFKHRNTFLKKNNMQINFLKLLYQDYLVLMNYILKGKVQALWF